MSILRVQAQNSNFNLTQPQGSKAITKTSYKLNFLVILGHNKRQNNKFGYYYLNNYDYELEFG